MAAKRTAKRGPARSKTPGKAKAAPRKARADAGTLTMRSASPSFTVNDLEKSLAWYRDVLGFVVEERWEDQGKFVGAQIRAGDVTFMVGQDDWKKGRDRKKGEGFRMFCTTTQNVDGLAERITARGGKLDQEPRDEPWGVRDFTVTDPDGFKMTIAAAKR
jgi:uncharacterized glyoxalase superfamily protein PhnB